MNRQLFGLVATAVFVLWRLWLWRKSKSNAFARSQSGHIERANHQTSKQLTITLFVSAVIVGEVLYKPVSNSPENMISVYLGLVLLALGLAFTIRDLQVFKSEWSESIFEIARTAENPTVANVPVAAQPWKPLWPLRLELVGLALFCGAVIAALTAWLFCSAHGKAVFREIEEAEETREIS